MPVCKKCARNYINTPKGQRDHLILYGHWGEPVIPPPSPTVIKVPKGFGVPPAAPPATPPAAAPPAPPVPPAAPPPTGNGFIEGRVVNATTNQGIVGATVSAGGNSDTTVTGGQFRLEVQAGRRYVVRASANNFNNNNVVTPADVPLNGTVTVNIPLQPSRGPPRIPLGGPEIAWTGPDLVRSIIAVLITVGVYFFFYRPIILEGLQVTDPYTPQILNFFVPFGMLFAIYFALPDMRKPDPQGFGRFITALIIAGVFTGMIIVLGVNFPLTKGPQSTSIQFGIPFATFVIITIVARKSLDDPKTKTAELILRLTGILALIGGGYFLLSLFLTGAYLNIETYLKPLDVLKVIGIPQSSIDSLKDGVRNTLGFLQFQGVNTQPEAQKVGGFDALQVKFGSKYNNYILPAFNARLNYTLPVNVINPNPTDSSLKVDNFYIDEVFLLNGSDKTMCGNVTDCTKYGSGGNIITGCTISPGDEKLIIIEFNNKTDCRDVVKTYDDFYRNSNTVPNPLVPVGIQIDPSLLSKTVDIDSQCSIKCSAGQTGVAVDAGCYNKCTKEACLGGTTEFPKRICGDDVDTSNKNYDVRNELDTNSVTFNKEKNVCQCTIKKYYNVADELCYMNNNKGTVQFKSHFNFSVEGKSALIVVKTESDKSSAPKPQITSSAGPLTVTAYFVPDTYFIDKPPQSPKMFLQINNIGTDGGVAQISGISYATDESQMKITSCVPDPAKASVLVDKSGLTVSCNVEPKDGLKGITGKYLTAPVVVDVNYTYSKSNSVDLTVKKATIPEEITDSSQIARLAASQGSLPYFCNSTMNIYGPFY